MSSAVAKGDAEMNRSNGVSGIAIAAFFAGLSSNAAVARSYEARIYAVAAAETQTEQSFILLPSYPGPVPGTPSFRFFGRLDSQYGLSDRTEAFVEQVKSALTLAGFTEAATPWEADVAIAFQVSFSAEERSERYYLSPPSRWSNDDYLTGYPASDLSELEPLWPVDSSTQRVRVIETKGRTSHVGDLRLQAFDWQQLLKTNETESLWMTAVRIEDGADDPAGLLPLLLTAGQAHFGADSGAIREKVRDRNRTVRYLRGDSDPP